jgi:hypothetical protein
MQRRRADKDMKPRMVVSERGCQFMILDGERECCRGFRAL